MLFVFKSICTINLLNLARSLDYKPPCAEEDFRLGQWIPGAHHCGLKDNYTLNLKLNKHINLTQPWHWSQWCWRPRDCEAVPFSKSVACHMLQGNDILFVGDSIHFEMFAAFVHQMDEILMFDQWEAGRMHLCDGNVTAGFLRNDHLRVRKEDEHINPHNRNQNFKDLLPMTDILILSKGHHVNKLELKNDEIFEKDTIQTVNYLKLYEKQLSIFFVTTSPGHVNCSRYSVANTSLIETTPRYITVEELPMSMRHYSWENYEKNDIFIINLFKRELNATIVHITPSSYLRPDDHRWNVDDSPIGPDCLHHRIPGVPDSWVYILFNLLYVQFTKANGVLSGRRHHHHWFTIHSTQKNKSKSFIV